MPEPRDDADYTRFLRLFAENEASLHTLIRAMLPARDESSQVLQNVIVVLWQKFDAAQDFRKWALGVARLEVLKYLQARQRDRLIFDDELVNRLADEAIAENEIHLTRREALDRCLKKLPDTQRELVLSAYAPGMRMDALAAQRGQTAMALYKFLHRIRKALLECVQRTFAKERFA